MPFARAVAFALCSGIAMHTAAVRVLESSVRGGIAQSAEASFVDTAAAAATSAEAVPRGVVSRPTVAKRRRKAVSATRSGRTARVARAPAATKATDPDLSLVQAFDPMTGKTHEVPIPTFWAEKLFLEGSVQYLGRRRHNCDAFAAHLAIRPEEQVMFRRAPSKLKSTQAEVHVASLLNANWTIYDTYRYGNFEAVFDVRSAGDSTFFLVETSYITLKNVMDSLTHMDFSGAWIGEPLPLYRSLPILIDLLRGCMELEAVGLMHGGLSPENIFIIDHERAFLRGLSDVCRCTEPGSACAGSHDLATDFEPCVSVDHTWAVGLLFAYMSLGYTPVEEFFDSHHARYQRWRAARAAVAWFITVDQAPRFAELDEDVQHLLLAWLVPMNDKWDTAKALREVEWLAQARGIRVPGPRWQPQFPPHYYTPRFMYPLGPPAPE